jgi:hypothetical protein
MQQYLGNHKVKGLVIGVLLSIVSFIIVDSTGYEGSKKYGTILISIMFVSSGIGNFLYAKQHPKQYTFGNVFAHGFKTAIVALLFFLAYNLLDDYLLHPNLKTEAVAFAKKSWSTVSVKEVSLELQQKNVDAFAKNYQISKTGVILIFFGVMGALGSLIGAYISPRKD